jgi:5'-nucleotidase (lipoprotein e(P4) family)
MKKILYCIMILIAIWGCNSKTKDSTNSLMGVQAVFWSQYAAEVEALYLQGYNVAAQILEEYDFQQGTLPPAVTLDIDETVLDNSPFSTYRLRNGLKYSEELWAEWCERREARPLPGALKFTNLADSLGIEVFYISNRNESLLDATMANLNKYAFPNVDSAHILLKNTSSSKDLRREKIRENHEIIVLIGDNLGDFEGIFDDRSESFGKLNVQKFEEKFGTRFIILPNAIYGSWERAVFPEGMPDEESVLDVLRGYEK